jgi:putative oxidoreductase
MTAVIQFYVFPEELLNPNGNWAMHLSWAAPLLVVLARGPGSISVDKLLGGGRNR